MITDQELWFSERRSFNDPFELLPNMDDIDEGGMVEMAREVLTSAQFDEAIIKNIFKNYEKLDATTKDMMKNFSISQVAGKTRICCFSKDPLNILMWSYYGDNHFGLCMGFDTNKDKKTFTPMLEVNYDENMERTKVSTIDLIKGKQSTWGITHTKSHIWSHEKEVRTIKLDTDQNIFKYKKEALVELIFGCNVADEVIDGYIKLLKDHDYMHVKIRRAAKHLKDYSLILEELS